MIRVIKDWGIDADSNGYQVGKIKTRFNKKLGKDEEYLANQKFPSSIKNAIQIILEAETRDLVMRNNMSLSETIARLESLNKEFTDILDKALKEKL